MVSAKRSKTEILWKSFFLLIYVRPLTYPCVGLSVTPLTITLVPVAMIVKPPNVMISVFLHVDHWSQLALFTSICQPLVPVNLYWQLCTKTTYWWILASIFDHLLSLKIVEQTIECSNMITTPENTCCIIQWSLNFWRCVGNHFIIYRTERARTIRWCCGSTSLISTTIGHTHRCIANTRWIATISFSVTSNKTWII